MSVISLDEYRKKLNSEQFERDIEASRFAMDAWSTAVESERSLPWEMAVKLIEQTMLDHGISLEDLKIRLQSRPE